MFHLKSDLPKEQKGDSGTNVPREQKPDDEERHQADRQAAHWSAFLFPRWLGFHDLQDQKHLIGGRLSMPLEPIIELLRFNSHQLREFRLLKIVEPSVFLKLLDQLLNALRRHCLFFGGPGDFIRTMARFANVQNYIGALHDAEDAGILPNTLRSVMQDWSSTDPKWSQAFAQAALHYGAHNVADTLNRVFGMQQARFFLADFANRFPGGRGERLRSMIDTVRRTGIKRLRAIFLNFALGAASLSAEAPAFST
jgi:hypothetical protein